MTPTPMASTAYGFRTLLVFPLAKASGRVGGKTERAHWPGECPRAGIRPVSFGHSRLYSQLQLVLPAPESH